MWRAMPTVMASAMRFWWRLFISNCSSPGLVMNAVSTKIDGMSGDFSTTKPACSTRALCTRPIFFNSSSTSRPNSSDWLTVSVIDISSSTPANWLSLSSKLTPPIKSEAFSLFASRLAVSLEAPRCDSAYTEAPRARGSVKPSA